MNLTSFKLLKLTFGCCLRAPNKKHFRGLFTNITTIFSAVVLAQEEPIEFRTAVSFCSCHFAFCTLIIIMKNFSAIDAASESRSKYIEIARRMSTKKNKLRDDE